MMLSGHSLSADGRSLLSEVLWAPKAAFVSIGIMTAAINILMLTGSMFMLQVYDRVLPSRSIATLIALFSLVAVLFAFQGVLEATRMRMLSRVGRYLDDRLNYSVYEAIIGLPLRSSRESASTQGVRDFDQIKAFLSSMGPTALFDLPWMPLYLAICFVFHFWLGVTALGGACILIALTALTERRTRTASLRAAQAGTQRLAVIEAGRRNAEAIKAMGMTSSVGRSWTKLNTEYMKNQQVASDSIADFGSASRILRMFLQSGVLAVGAYLVIIQEASAGIIIASSILVSRALAPVEVVIGNWKGFVAARQSWSRLANLLSHSAAADAPLQLPPPCHLISIEALGVAAPGKQELIVQNISFQVRAGEALGIIGPSASGKSTLARAIVGVWPAGRGSVRIDGASLEQWSADSLGKHVGYLPQDVELFAGTVGENIARFTKDAAAEETIAAAKAAGVHELILRLPDGYETRIGEDGSVLSAGQRQRVALARALFRDPFLVVLDEPNSNLDAEGDEALSRAVREIRKRNGVVIIVAHRPSALNSVDLLLALIGGRMHAFGPKDQVLAKVAQNPGAAPARGVEMVRREERSHNG